MQPLVQWVIISGVRSVANFLVTTLVNELNDVEYGAGASLREVLSLAGNNAEADTITFADSLAGGVISLIGINITHGDGDGLTVLNGDLDGDGVADITIMGDPNTTGFERNLLTNNGELSITGVDFVGGYGPNGGSAIQNNGDLTVANATISGGISRTMYEVGGKSFQFQTASAVSSNGDLRLSNVLFDNNDASGAGAFRYAQAATIYVRSGNADLSRVGVVGDGVRNDGGTIRVGDVGARSFHDGDAALIALAPFFGASITTFGVGSGGDAIAVSGDTDGIGLETQGVGRPNRVTGDDGVNGVSGDNNANLIDYSADATPRSLLGFGGDDTILGGSGNDTIAGGTGVNRVEGGDGSETLILQGGAN